MIATQSHQRRCQTLAKAEIGFQQQNPRLGKVCGFGYILLFAGCNAIFSSASSFLTYLKINAIQDKLTLILKSSL
jgi:hypothetical protein